MQDVKHQDLACEEEDLARRILMTSRESLLLQLPYLSRALFMMPITFYPSDNDLDHDVVIGFGTDGQAIYAVAKMVLYQYQKEQNYINHVYLHMLLHCLYQHLFQYEVMNFDLWDLACDTSVEWMIQQLNLANTSLEDDAKRKTILDEIQSKTKRMNAETIYAWLLNHREDASRWLKYNALFRFDLHHFWMHKDVEGKMYLGNDQSYPAKAKVSEQWKKMERAVQNEIQSYEKNQGYEPGTISKKFTGLPYYEYDYATFLKKFAVLHEEIKINHDEFDYVYYDYGMRLYGNIPLIEPLEYSEDNRIREFVVAIDTSGSVQGNMVKNFIVKTWSILSNADCFFETVQIHIIQCDSKIQSHVVIHNQAELQDYMKDFTIQGFGGTDFRPVFQKVNDMIDAKEIKNLKGLIYFTDGKGIFPIAHPSYETAFVMVDNGFIHPKVPAWAMRLILPFEEFADNQ